MRLRAVVLACSVMFVVLACAVSSAGASTWTITPTMTNDTAATGGSQCWGHSNWQGCMVLTYESVSSTGDWITDPFGGPGGRHLVPTLCNPDGSSCGGNGTQAPNTDQPAFDAPKFGYGADAAYLYEMPDGGYYTALADDDVYNGPLSDELTRAGCAATEVQNETFVCSADAGKALGANAAFSPTFTFFDPGSGSWASHPIAAGEVCTVPAGATNYPCAQGCSMNPDWCTSQSSPGNGWGSNLVSAYACTDPESCNSSSFLQTAGVLQFYTRSSSGPVTINDPGWSAKGLRATTGYATDWPNSCTIPSQNGTCWIADLPSVSAGAGVGGALTVTNPGSAPAEVVVLAQWSVNPENLYSGNPLGYEQTLGYLVQEAFQSGGVGFRPAPAAHPGSIRPAVRGLAVRVRRGGSAEVSYRAETPATTVFTVERESTGEVVGSACVPRVRGIGDRRARCTGWTRVGGRRVLAAVHERFFLHPGASRCLPRFPRRILSGGVCDRRVRWEGDFSHLDLVGANRVSFARLGGRKLRAGRYRLTAVSTRSGRYSRPVRVVFRVARGG